MIKVFTYRVSNQDEIKVVGAIIEAAIPGIEMTQYPMPQYDPGKILNDGDIAVTFGTTPSLAVRDCDKAIQHISLPAPKVLVNKAGNEESRDKAWDILQDLAKKLLNESFSPNKIVVTPDDMPELDAQHLLMLQQLTKKSNSRFCLQTSKNGKTIAIGDNIPIEVDADIRISFEELYTIKNVMDILRVDQVELVNL